MVWIGLMSCLVLPFAAIVQVAAEASSSPPHGLWGEVLLIALVYLVPIVVSLIGFYLKTIWGRRTAGTVLVLWSVANGCEIYTNLSSSGSWLFSFHSEQPPDWVRFGLNVSLLILTLSAFVALILRRQQLEQVLVLAARARNVSPNTIIKQEGWDYLIVSDPNYDECVVEIYCDGKFVGLLAREKEESRVSFVGPAPEDEKDKILRKVDLKGFLNALNEARAILLEEQPTEH